MSIKLRSHDDQNSNIVTIGDNICKCDEENEFHVIELAWFRSIAFVRLICRKM